MTRASDPPRPYIPPPSRDPGRIGTEVAVGEPSPWHFVLVVGLILVLGGGLSLLAHMTDTEPHRATCPAGYALAGGGWSRLYCAPGVPVEYVR